MKRQLSAALAAVAVIAAGALASACDVTPVAASANGTSISTASLNTQLATLQDTVAGGCLLQLENANLSTLSGVGAGGQGTFTMTYANAVLNNQVGDLLAQQFAASKGITLTASDLSTAKADFESTLDGEISQQVSTSSSQGLISYCQLADGSNITGQQLLAALPSSVRDAQVRNQAVDERLLARGADLSDAAVLRYYAANPGLFTQACVSAIATDTQAHAQALVSQINGGASFAAVAKASSSDTQTAANGGVLGCNYTLSQVEQTVGSTSVPVGRPLTPIQTSSGAWLIFEVTSQTVEPVTSAVPVIKQELLRATANVDRVSREILAFARTSDVHINPQYGTWKQLTIVPPTSPPSQYLLAAAGGTTTSSAVPATSGTASSGNAGSGSATSGSATSGSASSGNAGSGSAGSGTTSTTTGG